MSTRRQVRIRRRCGILAIVILGTGLASTALSAQSKLKEASAPPKVTDCDLTASNPVDRQRVGDGVAFDNINSDAAIAACEKAVADYPQIGRFYYQLGRALLKANRYERVSFNYNRAGELGHSIAWVRLGEEYSSGMRLVKDEDLGAWYLKKAALLGDPEGQTRYAEALFIGKGAPVDTKEALVWLNKAIAQGYPDAIGRMGAAYTEGLGVEKDAQKAFSWMERAAHAGSISAQGSLGYRYGHGIGVEQDQVKALEWTRKAAEAGDALSQFNLATFYSRGEGVEQNAHEMFTWTKKAAEQGLARAQRMVGRMFQQGVGTQKNEEEGLVWIVKAAEQGDAEAIVGASAAYRQGIGTAKSSKEAFKWTLKCAEANDVDCQLALGQFYLDGDGVERDATLGKAWLEKASKQGSTIAKSLLDSQQPKDALAKSYNDYQTIKACFETKQGYIVPTIGVLELEQARVYMRQIERASRLSQSDKDKLWQASTERVDGLKNGFTAWKMLGSGNARDSAFLENVCDMAMASLREATETQEGGQRKRDF